MIVKDKPVKKVKPDAVPVAAPPVQVLPKVGIPAGIVPPKPMAKKPKMDFGDFIPNLPVRPSVAKPGEEVVIDRPKAAYIPKKVAEAPKIYVRQMDAKEEIKKEPISKDKMRFPITTDELKKGVTVEQKLRALYDLQLIDSRIDKMRSVRGELPLEVQDLEDEIAQLETRIGNLEKETQTLEKDTAGKKLAIKDAENLIKKNKEQQNKVRNNREFESLSKEIEFQELEIQLHDKKIKDYAVSKVQKAEALEGSNSKMKDRKGDLKVKKTELDAIIKETEKEEKFLVAKSAEAQSLIELRLLQAYQRIRASSRNGLAVVPIEREASAGSFITIPPQKQMDVASRKKVMVDEHSGRILVDAELAREEEERIEFLLGEAMKKK
ncbi:MAG: hypothetical protein SH856_04080 [Flavobacteriales bacterium]|nr:hypothetical protein [Flavobacteriales bacterium]